jgi:hypothetical protein
MDIQTSPDPVARARQLGAEIVAAADEIERTRRIPGVLLAGPMVTPVSSLILGSEATR